MRAAHVRDMGASAAVINGRNGRGEPRIFNDQQAAGFLDGYGKSFLQRLHALRKNGLQGPAYRMLRQPGRHGDGMRTGKCQIPRRRDRARIDLQIKLHPSALGAASRRTAKDTATLELARTRRGLEILVRQFVVIQLGRPAILRSRLTSRAKTATAASTSASVVARPNPNRRLLSLKRSLRPKARNT